MRAILAGLLPDGIELLSLHDAVLTPPPDSVERFSTFTANARAKAEWCRDQSGFACIADDSGICVDALGGRPGIHSARWVGAAASAADRNARLLSELEAVQAILPTQRQAHFACSAAFAFAPTTDQGRARHLPAHTLSTYGIMAGYVVCPEDMFTGSGGFGYDPLFYSVEMNQNVAAAGESEKNRFSHRARALHSLASALLRLA